MYRNKMRHLALGDSYTIGEGVSEEDRWPVQLARLLGGKGIAIEPTIIARTGWTTAELQVGIDEARLRPAYDLVSLLIGVNNQYRGLSQEEYQREFVSLLELSIRLAGNAPGRVLVLSIPDWSVTPFADGQDRRQIAGEIASFNLINRYESERLGTHYLDVTPISREASDDPALIAEDGLHPSGKMYARWAEQVLPLALSALGSP